MNALLLQGVIALLLVLLASFTPDGFQTMVAYTAPAFWLFFLLTGVSLFCCANSNRSIRRRFAFRSIR